MTDSEQPQTIADKSRDVQQHFLDLASLLGRRPKDSPSDVPLLATRDVLDRFNLWAGNLGALHSPATRLSLDYRLSKAAEIRAEICLQLDEIVEALEDLKSITLGAGLNRGPEFDLVIGIEGLVLETGNQDDIQTSRGHADEADIILGLISECIRSLFRIGILVRNSTTCDRFEKAICASSPIPSIYDINHIREKHPKITADWLLARLGNANAKRRQFITYCQGHRFRLGGDILDTPTDRLSSKATTFVPNPNHNFPSLEAESKGGDDDNEMSLTSVSTTSTTLSDLDLPRLAELSKGEELFECPICFTLQAFKHEHSWRAHAFRDLKAYVCTVGEASCKDQLFGDRDSWFTHELKYHRAQYKCALCAHGPLLPKDLQAHIQQIHGPYPHRELHMLQDAGRQVIPDFNAQDCPFCDDWADALRSRKDPKGNGEGSNQSHAGIPVSSRRFKRHVATHLEYLAVFVLPRAAEEEGVDESKSTVRSLSDVSSRSEVDLEPCQQWMHSQSLGIESKPVAAAELATSEESAQPQVPAPIPSHSIDRANAPSAERIVEFTPARQTRQSPGARATFSEDVLSNSKINNVRKSWKCHECGHSGMNPSIIDACVLCSHWRCNRCLVDMYGGH